MKVPKRLRRFLALAAAVLIALGALALVANQASAEDTSPTRNENEWG